MLPERVLREGLVESITPVGLVKKLNNNRDVAIPHPPDLKVLHLVLLIGHHHECARAKGVHMTS